MSTKMARIEKLLLDEGFVSNVEMLSGLHGFKTNRLGAFICILRAKYVIHTQVQRDNSGNYIDCVYTLMGKI